MKFGQLIWKSEPGNYIVEVFHRWFVIKYIDCVDIMLGLGFYIPNFRNLLVKLWGLFFTLHIYFGWPDLSHLKFLFANYGVLYMIYVGQCAYMLNQISIKYEYFPCSCSFAMYNFR